jgi:hypothetical protein
MGIQCSSEFNTAVQTRVSCPPNLTCSSRLLSRRCPRCPRCLRRRPAASSAVKRSTMSRRSGRFLHTHNSTRPLRTRSSKSALARRRRCPNTRSQQRITSATSLSQSLSRLSRLPSPPSSNPLRLAVRTHACSSSQASSPSSRMSRMGLRMPRA